MKPVVLPRRAVGHEGRERPPRTGQRASSPGECVPPHTRLRALSIPGPLPSEGRFLFLRGSFLVCAPRLEPSLGALLSSAAHRPASCGQPFQGGASFRSLFLQVKEVPSGAARNRHLQVENWRSGSPTPRRRRKTVRPGEGGGQGAQPTEGGRKQHPERREGHPHQSCC